MALELRQSQSLKLVQQLIMTPQLQQAIKLLQLSRLDLVDTIHTELMENPLLEERTPELTEEVHDDRSDADMDIYDKEVALSSDWENYLGDFASTPKGMSERDLSQEEEMSTLEGRVAESPTLAGHLLWQLRLSELTERQKLVGEVIIGNLDAKGYLQATTEEIASMAGTTAAEVPPVLHAVQRFDPVGVAATSTTECLLIQIEVLGYDRDPVLVGLVTEHMADLENRNYKPLMRKYKLDEDDLREYLALIKTLDPIPGGRFDNESTSYVSPDAYVFKSGGDIQIVLNDDGIPDVSFAEGYEGMVSKAEGTEKDYFADKLRSAEWLIRSLHQRKRTLYKVLESIVAHQRAFFERGPSALKPLILRDIAVDVGTHESTVSRVTANKYVATEYGIFEMKRFFTGAIVGSQGENVAAEGVKATIRQLIAGEDRKAPLSDDALVAMLKSSLNIDIARRTVAKYRTALDIPSSAKRKTRL